ncbi:MAG TPA: hypothetical protein VFO60_05345, partial [Candidatus Dormibacteraeota bacterium]|nr:hypothetical protein [Candidatus Dormibacteraeota bacterium]
MSRERPSGRRRTGAGRRPPVPDAWIRAEIERPFQVDAAVLDVDGVLIDVEPSFRECVRVTTRRVQRLLGVPAPWVPSRAAIRALKRAGGFNDDIDVSVAVTAIGCAGLGGRFADLVAAITSAGGGLDGLRAVAPELREVSRPLVVRVFDEHYWGAAAFQERFGVRAEHTAGVRGLRDTERPL